LEHIGDHKLNRKRGGVGPLLRLLDCQRRQVDAGHFKALLSQPDAIGARPAANIERAASLNAVLAYHTL
jgi:hypothetical protein